jgi:hypothetical protein
MFYDMQYITIFVNPDAPLKKTGQDSSYPCNFKQNWLMEMAQGKIGLGFTQR